jgi:DNA-binding MarR family transcriptional regulator
MVKRLDQKSPRQVSPSAGNLAPAIRAASQAMVAAKMARLRAAGFEGVTPAIASLVPLLRAEGVRPTMLAQRSGVTKQAMTQLVRELEARGYVERTPDPVDARGSILRLTPAGIALSQACAGALRALEDTAVAALGREGLDRLQHDLAQLTTALEPPKS